MLQLVTHCMAPLLVLALPSPQALHTSDLAHPGSQTLPRPLPTQHSPGEIRSAGTLCQTTMGLLLQSGLHGRQTLSVKSLRDP